MEEFTKERLARNESLFRDVNENINDAAQAHGSVRDGHQYSFFCECADIACVERVELSLSEYQAIRGDGKQFVVAPGHVFTAIEAVVKVEADHLVVEKVGVAGDVAEHLDPRAA